MSSRMAWRIVGSQSGVLAGLAAWSVASGVALGLARLVAQRGAAEAWHAATGSYPDDMESVTP